MDGYIARHYNQTTDFGKFMDPLADKVLVLAAMLWFCQAGGPARLGAGYRGGPGICRIRPAAGGGGQWPGHRGRWSGKVKTFATMVCLCIMHLPVPPVVDYVCVAVIAVTTLYSGVEYFVKNKDVLNWNK